MKYIPYIYYIFGILSLLDRINSMVGSTEPLYFFISGIASLFVLWSFGALIQIMLNTSKAVEEIASRTELHTKALKHLTNAKRIRKG